MAAEQLVHAFERHEVGLDGFDRHAERMEVLRSIVDGRLIGDQQIETMVGAAFGQLVANADLAPVTMASGRVWEATVASS